MKYPIHQIDIRREFSNTNFPSNFSPPEGYEEVVETKKPEYNKETHEVKEGPPKLNNAGVWCQTWTVYKLPAAKARENRDIFKTELLKKTQRYLDLVVSGRRYDSMLSACSYASSTNPIYAAEALACIVWRDKVWDAIFSIMDEIDLDSSYRPNFSDIEQDLPKMLWPPET